jgi:hypothetical protein
VIYTNIEVLSARAAEKRARLSTSTTTRPQVQYNPWSARSTSCTAFLTFLAPAYLSYLSSTHSSGRWHRRHRHVRFRTIIRPPTNFYTSYIIMKGYTSTRSSNKENGPSQMLRPRRMPLSDITNEVDWLRRSLESELSTPAIASAPQGTRRARTAVTSKRNKSSSGRASMLAVPRHDSENIQSSDESSLGNEPLLSPPTSRPSTSARPILGQAIITTAPSVTPSITDLADQFAKICSPVPGASSAGDREPWTSAQVPPKTHKTTSGQLVILPSHATLVDFREGERRKGKKGDEVIVVSPDGLNVSLCILSCTIFQTLTTCTPSTDSSVQCASPQHPVLPRRATRNLFFELPSLRILQAIRTSPQGYRTHQEKDP